MPLRLLEVIVPEQYFNDISGILSANEITEYWQTCSCESRVIFKIILQAEKTESLMDKFERRFKHLEDFRLILLPLEASCPTPRDIEQKSRENESDREKEKTALRISRQELYNQVYHGSLLSRVFLVMVVLSAIVAAVGLLRNNVAVIIGAMVIAPLLGPNVALSLAAALGDGDLGSRAVRTAAAGSMLAFGVHRLVCLYRSKPAGNTFPDHSQLC